MTRAATGGQKGEWWLAGPFLAMAMLAVFVLPHSAAAHAPALEDSVGLEQDADEQGEPIPIGGPEKSRAIYGYVAERETDAYAFTTTDRVTTTVRVIVPAYPEHEGFRPSIMLEADGAEVARAQDSAGSEREAEFEPFSLTWFWQGPALDYEFAPGEEYVVRIEPGDGSEASGRYVLTFSGPEEFTGSDIRTTIRGLPRIWYGAYGGAPLRWNTLALIPVVFLLLAVGAVAYPLIRRVSRRRA